jgi:hypothetical protein
MSRRYCRVSTTIRAGEQPLFHDLVAALKSVIVERLVLDSTIGDWEIWRLR